MSLPSVTLRLEREEERVRVVVDGGEVAARPAAFFLEAIAGSPDQVVAGIRLWQALGLPRELVERLLARPHLWRIEAEDPELHALPWEALALPGKGGLEPGPFLFHPAGKRHLVVRGVPGARARVPAEGPLRVLLVLAHPGGGVPPVSLVPEALELLDLWEAEDVAADVEAVTRPEHMAAVLGARGPYGIVHVVAHGVPGATVVEGEGGGAPWRWAEALAAAAWRPVVLLLNHCHGTDAAPHANNGGGQAVAAARSGVPLTVAAAGALPDAGAVVAARALHEALLRGEGPVAERLAAARLAFPAGDLWWRYRVVAAADPPGGWPATALEAARQHAARRRTLIRLPGPPRPLVPRLEALRRLLATATGVEGRGRVWVYGTGGCGKSVLLGLVARLLRLALPAVAAVDAREMQAPQDLVARLAQAAGMAPPGGTGGRGLRQVLAALPRPALVIVDDLTPHQDASGALAAPWAEALAALAAAPGVRLLASSRIRPRLSWDQPGSEMEGWAVLELGGFTQAEAQAYLRERLGERAQSVPRAELEAVVGERAGTHPLTLSLLAGAIEEEGWATVRDDPELTRETARARFLDQLWRAVAGDEATRRLAHALALLELPVPAAVLRQLAPPEALQQLRRWSVLERLEAGDEVWSALHPVIRDDWAARTREELDEHHRRRLAGELAAALREAGTGRRSAELHAEAARLFLEAGDTEGAWSLLDGPLAVELRRSGQWERYRRLLEAVLKAPDLDDDRRARTLHELGVTRYFQGRLDEAEKLYRRSLEIRERLDDQVEIAKSLHQLGILAQDRGRLEEAEKLYRRSLEIRERLDDQAEIAKSLHQLGMLARGQGRLEEAEELSRSSLEIFDRLGDQAGIAASLHQLGMLAQDQGRLEEAEELYRRSLEIFERFDDTSGVGKTLHQLGSLAYIQGRLDEAEELYRRSLEIFDRLGDQGAMAKSLHSLGVLAQARGRLEEAEELYRRSLEIKERLGDQAALARSLHQLGVLAQARDRLDEAEALYRRSLEMKERLGDQAGIAASLHQLGRLAHVGNRLDEAEELYRCSLEIFERLDDPAGMAASIGQLALLAERRGDRQAALAGHGRAEELFLRSGREPDAAFARYHAARLLAEEGDLEAAARAAAVAFAVLAASGSTRWQAPARLLSEIAANTGTEALRRIFLEELGRQGEAVWAAWARAVEIPQ